MHLSQTAVGFLYLCAALLGAAFGLFYDLLRLSRIFLGVHYSRPLSEKLQGLKLPLLSPRREHEESPALGVVIFLQDFFFGILFGVALSILYYELNDGKIRPFALVFCAIGFFLYRLTLGKLFLLFSEAVAFVFESALRYLWYFLSYPLKAAGKLLCRVLKKITLHIQSCLRRFARVRFYKKEVRKLEAGRGLFPGPGLPHTKKKRGKTNGNRKKAPLQSVAFDKNFPLHSRSAFGRRLRDKRHEVQPLAGRKAGTPKETRSI